MKQVQRQQLQQKFSPQQIQLMRLLQLPVTDLEQAITEEIEKNPLLEAELQDEQPLPDNDRSDWDADEEEEFGFDYREHLESDPNAVRREFVVSDSQSANERLMQQLSLRPLSERQRLIAAEIVGTLDDAGYLGRSLDLIANDMAFRQGIEVTTEEVEAVLAIVQSLDPAGIGARSLQECLMLQLERNRESGKKATQTEEAAIAIVRNHFDDFANHRYERICESLGLSEEAFEEAADCIRHLNPKPGGSTSADTDGAAAIIPDIVLTQHDGHRGPTVPPCSFSAPNSPTHKDSSTCCSNVTTPSYASCAIWSSTSGDSCSQATPTRLSRCDSARWPMPQDWTSAP